MGDDDSEVQAGTRSSVDDHIFGDMAGVADYRRDNPRVGDATTMRFHSFFGILASRT